MATVAEIGYLTTLGYSADGTNYTSLPQLVDVTAPDISVEAVKVTNNDSASFAHEYIPGLVDGGTITASFIYKEALMTTLMSLVHTTYYWKHTTPDSSTYVCQGFITNLKMGNPLEQAETVDVTIKLTGRPVFTQV